MNVTFRGFHGTPASRVESIRASGIYPSDNPDDWLGEGAYFFIDGLEDARTCAAQWARCKAWNKQDQEFEEHAVAVVEATITVEAQKVFDLRKRSNVQLFHQMRRRWLRRAVPRRSAHLPRPEKDRFDTELLDDFKHENGIAVLIGDFHIQLSLRERYFRLDSRIPNVTVLCLSNDEPTASVEIVDVVVEPHYSRLQFEEQQ